MIEQQQQQKVKNKKRKKENFRLLQDCYLQVVTLQLSKMEEHISYHEAQYKIIQVRTNSKS